MKKKLFLIVSIIIFNQTFAQQTISLNKTEIDDILFMREEEKLARDVYDSLYNKYGGNPFNNIRKSEQVHMNRMKDLITTYKLQDPVDGSTNNHGIFKNSTLQNLYYQLVKQGSQSITEAYKVGALIEEIDIKDLDDKIEQTTNQNIIAIYTMLKRASQNHIRAFVRNLKREGIQYIPTILSEKQLTEILEE